MYIYIYECVNETLFDPPTNKWHFDRNSDQLYQVFQLFPIIFTCSQHFPKPSIAAAELQIHSQLQLLSGQLNDLLLAEKMLPFRAIFHRKMRLESIGNSGAQTLQAIYNI